eukprot:c15073_g1_i1 orf=73-939(+)
MDNNNNMYCAWKGSSEQGCSHLAAAAAAPTSNFSASPGAPKASWTVPSLYDHSSLLECTRCTQGRSYGGGGLGQGSNMMDGEVMQELQYLEEEEEMCMGMEMKMMKKRKLTSEQARQLEASFEADKKLEAEKKQRLAAELGLQPRQVAVWFQNRRARSKTKQLEIDFVALKAEYDRVLSQRRALQAEIARLAAQLQDKNSGTKVISCSQESTSSTNSNNGDLISESTTLQIRMESSTKDSDGRTSNFGQENKRNKECTPRLQDLSKFPNIATYDDWDHPYENGLWVFD